MADRPRYFVRASGVFTLLAVKVVRANYETPPVRRTPRDHHGEAPRDRGTFDLNFLTAEAMAAAPSPQHARDQASAQLGAISDFSLQSILIGTSISFATYPFSELDRTRAPYEALKIANLASSPHHPVFDWRISRRHI